MSGRLLLDTHVVLWYLEDSAQIPEHVYHAIDESAADVFVSAASLWEIAIKTGLGKLRADSDLPVRLADAGFISLDVSAAHAWSVRELPAHHRDPFDRILVAQAKLEGLRLVTRDPLFASYDGLDIVW